MDPTSIVEYFENVESVIPPFRSEVGTYHIRFHSFASAFEALRNEEHTINGCTIRLCHEWYYSEMKKRITVDNTLQQINDRLNDDCILSIMELLDFEEMLYVAYYNDRFRMLAETKAMKITPSTIPRPIGILTLMCALDLFSDTITSLEISLTSIRPGAFNAYSFYQKCGIIHCIQTCAGPQLALVTLEGFLFNENPYLFRSLTWKLEQRGVQVVFS